MWLIVLWACGTGSVENTVTEGTACADDASGEITFTFDTCLSSSCDTLSSASCTATLSGDTLTVTGEAVIVSEGDECTDDCGAAVATCQMPELPSEDVSVVVGDQTLTLDEFVCAEG